MDNIESEVDCRLTELLGSKGNSMKSCCRTVTVCVLQDWTLVLILFNNFTYDLHKGAECTHSKSVDDAKLEWLIH